MPDSWQQLRERLESYDFRPSKRLGQNFLVDPKLAAAIADELEFDETTLIVEIGAGPGSLTRELARKGRVLAVEIDARLAAFLREEMRSWSAAEVRLLECDALEKGRLAPALRDALREELAGAFEQWVCVSNLPYSSAGPFLAAVIQAECPPVDGVVLTQWEFGERLAAPVGSENFGSLSVQAQLAFAPKILRRVPPDVFRPRPRVDSSLVRLGRAQAWLRRTAEERRDFGRFVQALFTSRRKVLRRGLELAGFDEAATRLSAANLDPQVLRLRPDALAPGDFVRVWEAMTR